MAIELQEQTVDWKNDQLTIYQRFTTDISLKKPIKTMTAKKMVRELYPHAKSMGIIYQSLPEWRHGFNIWIGETIVASGASEISAWQNAAVRITKYYRNGLSKKIN